MARFGSLDTQYFDASGEPLVNGKIYFYESGTTTPKTTYADINSAIPNTNPVLLDASGRQPNIFFEGVAKATLTNKSDVQIVSRDPVGETTTNFGDEWVSTRIYGTNDVVIASDGQYYRSLSAGNQNNNPTTTSGYWTLLYSVEWNSGINYGVGATVTYDTLQYQSLQASNLNHNPSTSPTWWVPLEFVWSATSTYDINQNVVGADGILYTSLQAANINHDPATSPTWWVGTSAAAAASATAALASEVAAQTAETGAQTAQTAAELAETNAETAQAAAEAAKVAAELAETNAETAETNAAASATASATSATASAASATAAATSATNASTSETNAANSATASATSATNSANSATASASSATAAAGSATTAEGASLQAANKAIDAATSATAAAASATAAEGSSLQAANKAIDAATSATAAEGSAIQAGNFAINAATAEAGAEAALDQFTDIYLGTFASDPTVDNDGGPLAEGMLYYNSVDDVMRVYNGSAWQNVADTVTSILLSQVTDVTATAAEVNILDGVTATTAELNYLDITTLGTTEASKVVTADVNGDVNVASGNLSVTGTLSSGAITATGGAAVSSFIRNQASVDVVAITNQAANGRVLSLKRESATQDQVRSFFNCYADSAGSPVTAFTIWSDGGFVAKGNSSITGTVEIDAGDLSISNNQYLYMKDTGGTNRKMLTYTSGLVMQIGDPANVFNTGIEFYPGGIVAGANKMVLGTDGSLTLNSQYIEKYTATGTTGAVTIDLDTGNNFSTALSGAVTYTFSNAATSGFVSSFTLKVVNNGSAITWPTSVDWPDGIAPTLSASGATDVFVFYTHDGGATWYGFTAGQAMA